VHILRHFMLSQGIQGILIFFIGNDTENAEKS